jgi:Mg-chelatase subunit ChlD
VLVVGLAACSADTPSADRHSASSAATSTGAADGGAHGAFDGPASLVPSSGTHEASDGDGGVECGRQKFEVQRKPADLLLVLDRSASMQDDVHGDSKSPSKWELVVPALQQVVNATDSAVSWGLSLFPQGDKAGECKDASYPRDIAVPVAPNNAAAVSGAIAAATPQGDGTPTADAVDEALKYLQTLPDANPKYILLATDGEPSCAGTAKGASKARPAAVSAVEGAAAAGVDTFVIGIATSKGSASDTLTELAKAGGEAPMSGYYLASSQAELVTAMQRITGSVATCVFPLATKAPEPEHVGVLIGTRPVHRDTGKQNGWDYADPTLSGVQLFGDACDMAMSDGAQPVSVVFGCEADAPF